MKTNILIQILGGLAMGLALGLWITWVLAPVQYTDTSPISLRSVFKDQYRIAIASAFSADKNIERARARLALLGDTDPGQTLVNQAQQIMASGESMESAYEIAVLVNALNSEIPTLEPTLTLSPPAETKPSLTPSPFGQASTPKVTATVGPSPTPRATATPHPTVTPSPTPGAPFVIFSREEVCDPSFYPGILMVEVRNKKQQPIPGQELVITWSGGEEHFFTGLKPEISNGYADFIMQRDIPYSIHSASGGETATGIVAPLCSNKDGTEYLGAIRLVFSQP